MINDTLDIARLQQLLRQFAAERDWEPFHAPKNLAMALTVEAAELAEIFQWMEPEASRSAHSDHLVQEQIGDEVSDVMLYLLQIADHCAIDLARAVERKLEKNARKHPPKRLGAVAAPSVQAPEPVHVLVDWENVQPRDQDLLGLVPGASHAWIFHGRTQKNVDADQGAFREHLTLIPISRSGKNALDFHLALYLGYIASRNPRARIVVVSNDQGYGPMLEHARSLGFDAHQVGFQRPAARRSSRVRGAPAAPRQAATTRSAQADAPKPVQASGRSRKAAPAEAPSAPVAGDPGLTAAPAVRRSRRGTPAAPGSDADARTSDAPAAAGRTRRSTKVAEADSAATPAAKRSRRKTPAASAALFTEVEYAHVRSTLHKNRNKPTRQARLLSLVRSLLDGGKADPPKVQAVVDRLIAEGLLQVSAQGAVTVA
jgi:NTP pyrophosphatase (non-canonical NTP hydrolase)